MHRFRRSRLPFIVAMLAALVVLPTFAGETDAATIKWTAKCDDIGIRTRPKVTATKLREVNEGAVVTAVGSVSGGVWSAECGKSRRSDMWLKIVAINGRSTRSLFDRSAVYAANGLFKASTTTVAAPTATLKPTPTPTPKPTATPTPTPNATPKVPPLTGSYLSNCAVRLRSSASTDASTSALIDENVVVTSSSTVSGGTWAADCKTSVSGTTWYRITTVGGKSVSSLYGVDAVYAASGLFRSVTSSTGYQEGIDVSHWQGAIDWAQVRAADKKFVIAKATEGVGFMDDRYVRNKAGAMGQGLKFGAYHFAQPANDPIQEADWFVNNSGYERGMLIPTLDLERTGGRSATGLTNWTKAWLQRVDERLGVKPMIYASPTFWRENLNDTRWFADNGYAILWVAHWNTSSPSVPGSNWGGRSWTFWQYTSSGTVPGISGRVDLNRFRYPTFDSVTY